MTRSMNLKRLPASLEGIRNGDWHDIEHEIVVPSWNDIPLRMVVLAGRTVAVINFTETDEVVVVESMQLESEAEARERYREVYARECAIASDIFADLPEEEKVGALIY